MRTNYNDVIACFAMLFTLYQSKSKKMAGGDETLKYMAVPGKMSGGVETLKYMTVPEKIELSNSGAMGYPTNQQPVDHKYKPMKVNTSQLASQITF